MSNFQKRTLTAVIGGAIMIALLMLGRETLLFGLAVVSLVGFFELTKACGVHTADKKINALEIIGVCASLVWYVILEIESMRYICTEEALAAGLLVLIISLVGYMSVYVFSFPKYNATQVMAALFALIYSPFMISFIYLIRSMHLGEYLVWMIFVCSWMCDIFAYLVGMKFGKKRMAPVLSPKKSVEGAIGGVAGSAVIGALYATFVLAPQVQNTSRGLLIGVIVVISILGALVSMVGDLAASAIKRNHDIKDYGNILPGHGGIMDRFDSAIFVSPMVYILSLIFLKFVIGM